MNVKYGLCLKGFTLLSKTDVKSLKEVPEQIHAYIPVSFRSTISNCKSAFETVLGIFSSSKSAIFFAGANNGELT